MESEAAFSYHLFLTHTSRSTPPHLPLQMGRTRSRIVILGNHHSFPLLGKEGLGEVDPLLAYRRLPAFPKRSCSSLYVWVTGNCGNSFGR